MNIITRDLNCILFQGDEITEGNRDYSNENSLGNGYVKIFADKYSESFNNSKTSFINRGVSGDRVHNLIERYIEDIMDVSFDCISVLAGVNDVTGKSEKDTLSTPEAFRDHYEYLLKMIKSHKPDAKIILIEPFIIPLRPEMKKWTDDLEINIQALKSIEGNYADSYIPMNDIFRSLCKDYSEAKKYTTDGIIPSEEGNRIIAEEILKLFSR